MAREHRRLAAIVAADVVGYSRLMGRDESGTLTTLKMLRHEIVDPPIAAYGGRIVKTTGDGLLLEFASVVDAVRCVVEMQTAMAGRSAKMPEHQRIQFRVGVNIGDIIVDGDDIFGDGVNVAARLQEIAPPGGVAISGRVHDDVVDRLEVRFEEVGPQSLKNIARPVPVWRWFSDAAAPAAQHRRAAIAVIDLARFSTLVAVDEAGTLTALQAWRNEVVKPLAARHGGRVVRTHGDSLMLEFPEALAAMRCAIEVQAATAARGAAVPEDRRIACRIGMSLGDVLLDGDDMHGDAVNIAHQLEGLADPGGVCISEAVYRQVHDKMDAMFIAMGERQLKFVAQPVSVWRLPAGAQSESSAPPLPLPDKPSIAVLPFQNMSGDPEQEYFADGMVEEIITALSYIPWLFVIARNSSFTYKGQTIDVKRVGRELGVQYALEGSVRRSGDRVRIAAQLIDIATGAHLWADRFDGSLAEVFELQDKIAGGVAGAIEPAVEATESRRSIEHSTKEPTAYDWYLRALPDCNVYNAKAQTRARELLDRAIERDPNFGAALARAAHCSFHLVFHGRSENPAAEATRAKDYAKRALAVGNNDPGVLVHAALTLAYFGEDIGAMIALCDRALSLNPSFARGWHIGGVLRRWAGQSDIGIKYVEMSMRLSPRMRVGTPMFAIGQAHFLARRFEEAIPKLLLAIQDDPGYPEPYRTLAACYAHSGRLEDARRIIAQLRTITPVIVHDANYLRDPAQRNLYLSGLRLAMGEMG